MNASARIEIQAAAPWPTILRFESSAVIGLPGSEGSRLSSVITWETVPASGDLADVQLAPGMVFLSLVDEGTAASRETPASPPGPESVEAARGRDPKRAIGEFEAVTASGDARVLDAATEKMAALLVAVPTAANECRSWLFSSSANEASRAAMFLALSRSGTDAARSLLLEILESPARRSVDRRRAAGGLATLRPATPEVVTALARQSGQKLQEEVATAAALAIGSLDRWNRTGAGVQSAESARGVLHAALSGATDVTSLVVWLDAAANSGHPSFLGAIRQHSHHPDSAVRRHAALALGSQQFDEVDALACQWLKTEMDSHVVGELADSLVRAARNSNQTPSRIVAAEALSWLERYPPSGVRQSLVDLMGLVPTLQPEFRRRLRACAQRETEPRIRAGLEALGAQQGRSPSAFP